MRTACQKAAFPAVARVRLWSGSRPAGSVFGVSGFDPGSRSSPSLVCPGGHSLGRCGGASAGRTRTGSATGERGAGLASKLWHPQSRSPSASKSERTHTRANLPAYAGQVGSVEGLLRTPRSLDGGVFRSRQASIAICLHQPDIPTQYRGGNIFLIGEQASVYNV